MSMAFHPTNTGLLAQKAPGPAAVHALGRHPASPIEYQLDLTGLRAVVVGASNIVGRPMALELLFARSTVTVCHTGTRDLRGEVERAELVVAAVGKAAYIPGIWIRDGAIVMDVGINRDAAGKLCGDVEYSAAAERRRVDHSGSRGRRADDDRHASVQYGGCRLLATQGRKGPLRPIDRARV
jgi:methylenetetrahydrofolate dehydrogenase (NADP+)/methenyltetrahydrofolate cyclohydrolase